MKLATSAYWNSTHLLDVIANLDSSPRRRVLSDLAFLLGPKPKEVIDVDAPAVVLVSDSEDDEAPKKKQRI